QGGGSAGKSSGFAGHERLLFVGFTKATFDGSPDRHAAWIQTDLFQIFLGGLSPRDRQLCHARSQLRASERAARSLAVSTCGSAGGNWVRWSKNGDGRWRPRMRQLSIFDARLTKIPNDGGGGALDGRGPTAESS